MTHKVIEIDYNYGIKAIHDDHYKTGCSKIINDLTVLRGEVWKSNPSSPRK